VKAGDILEAQETAKLITDSTYQGYAATDIAIAQAKAGDIAGATKTAALGNPISKWQVDSAIADAKRRAAEIAPTNASVSQSSAVQPNSVPPHQIAPPSLPAITLADWIGEIDNYLNKPLYSDLADAVKNPQQAFKTIYSGGWDFDHGGDAMKDFLGLKAIASVVVDEKNKIDQMLKQQAKQQAQQNTVKALDDDFEVKKSGDTPHIPPPPPPPPSH
jgi:hypothetical protein